jgi:hypothetical protein
MRSSDAQKDQLLVITRQTVSEIESAELGGVHR